MFICLEDFVRIEYRKIKIFIFKSNYKLLVNVCIKNTLFEERKKIKLIKIKNFVFLKKK